MQRDLVLLKARRPVYDQNPPSLEYNLTLCDSGYIDWARVLSPPEDFLSTARDCLLNGRASNVPTTVRTTGSEQTQVTGAVNHETPQSFNQPEETNAGRAYKDSTVSFRSDGDSVAIATPVSSNNGQSSRVSIVQAAHTATETDQRFEPSRLRSSQQGKPQHVKSNSELADDKAQAGKQNQDDALVDVSTPPSGSTTIVRTKDLYYDNVQTEGKTGILLTSTPLLQGRVFQARKIVCR